jgi:hypothetical protein
VDTKEGDRLVAALASNAREFISDKNPDELEPTLRQVVASAVETVPGADAGGISLASKGRVESRAALDDRVRRLDELQAGLGEGPCMAALDDPELGTAVVVDDLSGTDADRWPSFAEGAQQVGYRSMLSTQLSADGGVHAALNLYAHDAGVFDDYARTLAALFGVQAALVLYGVERANQLQTALGTRDVIGQAKGILMERYAVDADHAFQMLVRSSQDTNMKLTDVARWLTTDGRKGATGAG